MSTTESLPPGRFGTYISFTLMIIGITISIILQQYAKSHIHLSSWNNGCPNNEYYESCKGNSAVLRISFAFFIFFMTQVVGTAILTRYYDVLWIVKICSLGAILLGFYFANSSVFDVHGYAWLARILAFFYVILQQIILLDFAYIWNEKWLEYAGDEKNSKWLFGLLFVSFILFAGSVAAIGVMFWQFKTCSSTQTIISLTLILAVIAYIVQLFFSELGSILTSSIMMSYATYVCYSAVTLNPHLQCNPTLDSGYQTISTIIGIVLTVISLSWTTWNTITKIPSISNISTPSPSQSIAALIALPQPDKETGDVPKENQAPAEPATTFPSSNESYNSPGLKSSLVQISCVFVLVSGYYAMILTNWSTMQSSNAISSPKTGDVAMWIQAAGQWIAIILYLWSLLAPRCFPDRDFS
eukprot:gene5153-7173_t